MSTDFIIKIDKLSKKYQLVHQRRTGKKYQRLSDVLLQSVTKPFSIARNRILGKEYLPQSTSEDFWALKDISLEVKRGEVLGVIGRNGAGKSTLLKILSRITDPSEGRVRIRGRVASLLEVGTGFHNELTGRENIYLNGAILGMTRNEIKRKFDEIVVFAEVERFLDTPVKHYSSGMYVRLAFAVAAHLEPEILIVDEVLAVGDTHFQKKCLGKMQDVSQKEGRTVLFVSHNLGTILNLCSRGVVLEKGQLVCDKSAAEAVDFYQHSLFPAIAGTKSNLPHVIYDASNEKFIGDMAITKIELLDDKGQPKAIVGTWDHVTIRIRYRSNRKVIRGSVDLQISSTNSVSVIHLATEPDSAFPMDILPGEHAIDCTIPCLPLSAGDYIIGGALSIPCVEWLWHQPELAVLTISPRDVFESGLAPNTTRAMVAPHHQWSIPQ